MFDILFAAGMMLAPQAAPTWQVIDINNELKRVLTVDVGSVPASAKPDAIINARIFVTVDMPEISALTGFWSIDCGKNLHRVSGTSTFDKAGKISEADPDPLPWEANAAGSLFDSVAKYACRGVVPHPGKSVTGNAPIAAANAMLQR